MQIVVKHSVMVRVDNVGAIFMASNIMTTSHTKHVDIQYKYVNEYVEDGIVKIITKNLSTDLHEKHARKMVVEKP